MTNLQSVISIICVLLTSFACQTRDFERSVFSHSLGTRVERLRQLPLEQQYKVFRYGNDVIHPPLMDLADPIAERGAAAVPFLLKQLRADRDDIATRDILLIFVRMYHLRTYDVKSDDALMKTLISSVADMRDKDWQAICQKRLVVMRAFEMQPR
jgi:hypothetical protein